jgi:hypothetical protein
MNPKAGHLCCDAMRRYFGFKICLARRPLAPSHVPLCDLSFRAERSAVEESHNFWKRAAEQNIERCLDLARHDNRALQGFVLEMALALERLRVFVLAQDIFIELHVGAKEVLEPSFDALSIL